MAGKFISSNSTVRETVALLKEEKRLVREIEAKIVEQSMADAAHKKMMSEHRIATKWQKYTAMNRHRLSYQRLLR